MIYAMNYLGISQRTIKKEEYDRTHSNNHVSTNATHHEPLPNEHSQESRSANIVGSWAGPNVRFLDCFKL